MKTIKLFLISFFVIFSFIHQANGKIGIIINKDLYPSIKTSIDMYIKDLKAIENMDVWLEASTFDDAGTVYQLKDTLKSHYTNDDLEAAIFIGDLPIAMYKKDDTFPCDFYFMDLNGTWAGSNGIFNSHSGNKDLEIWVSRITSSVVSKLGTEEEIIKKYFEKVHKRMTGQDDLDRTYCIMGDNESWPVLENENLSFGDYPSDKITTYKKPNDTKQNLQNEMKKGHEYLYLYEHSLQTLHALSGGVFNLDNDYYGITSDIRFYHLFACLNSRFTEENCGTAYALGHNGLLALGSTKSGSMVQGTYKYYNDPLTGGLRFGEAFKKWANDKGINMAYAVDWHYGLTMQGVGTLKLKPYDPTPIKNNEKKTGASLNTLFAIPNPSGKVIYFTFYITESMRGDFIIYDVKGNVVYKTSQLYDKENGKLPWNLTNSSGKRVSAGVYLAVLKLIDSYGKTKTLKTNIVCY